MRRYRIMEEKRDTMDDGKMKTTERQQQSTAATKVLKKKKKKRIIKRTTDNHEGDEEEDEKTTRGNPKNRFTVVTPRSRTVKFLKKKEYISISFLLLFFTFI